MCLASLKFCWPIMVTKMHALALIKLGNLFQINFVSEQNNREGITIISGDNSNSVIPYSLPSRKESSSKPQKERLSYSLHDSNYLEHGLQMR